MDILLLLGIFALWIILQVWVLPKAGVPTLMGGACEPRSRPNTTPSQKAEPTPDERQP
jgi:hypothetical protein